MAVSSSSSIDRLPQDMTFEIIRRTNISSLDSCKAVCKNWRKLVYDPSFIENYYERKDNINGYLLQAVVNYGKYEQKFVSVNESDDNFTFSTEGSKIRLNELKIVGSSLHGILCCENGHSRRAKRFYVCKPTTGQWQPLPNPKTRYHSETIGFAVLSTKPLRYVILRISDSKKGFCRERMNNYFYGCEMFDSKDWRWKELEDLLLPWGMCLYNRPAVYAGGYFSWLTSKGDVVSLTTDGKSHRILAMPDAEHYRDNPCGRIIEYESKLAYIFNKPDSTQVDIWIMKDWTYGVWERIRTVDLHPLATNLPYWSTNCFYGSGVAVITTGYRAIFYRLKNSTFRSVNTGFSFLDKTFPFRSDFEPVCLKGTKPEPFEVS